MYLAISYLLIVVLVACMLSSCAQMTHLCFISLKVQLLENKLGDYKQKKVEFMEKARQHEKSIRGFRSYEDVDLPPGPSPIHPGGATGCGHVPGLSLSPTLPLSGYTPNRGKESGVSPRYSLNYPVTSTPATR